MESRFPDCPRSLKRLEIKEERLSFLENPRIAHLTGFVNKLRKETGRGNDIPYFDPLDGGTEAKCLFLFEAPGGKALESNFVSRNNDDGTAENFFYMNVEADFERTLTISWNVVPWALRENRKNRPPTPAELKQGLKCLKSLLDIVEPEIVVLCGKKSWSTEQSLLTLKSAPHVLHSYHPSPQNINSRPEMRERIVTDISKAKSRLLGPKG